MVDGIGAGVILVLGVPVGVTEADGDVLGELVGELVGDLELQWVDDGLPV